jgi:hypothetical protein
MTAPLDEKGLEAARAIKSPRCTCAYEDLATAEARIKALEEALREALYAITEIDNAHKVVRKLRTTLNSRENKE